MRALAIRAAALFAIGSELELPLFVCPPCGTSHGDWFPGERYTSHARVQLTPSELEVAARLRAAVCAGAVSRTRLELARGFDSFLEHFVEEAL